ncbi:hypothetical protein [Streptomyces sp. I05A-00742]|uniref:hypothetical protein n=1 Tax=Streptomyces sp. I05A-00742 TaxID=2732853 RepID=UPI00148882C2|nr:hypothetical protein [Streptomyces sp. I05A-00742]
MRKTVMAVVMVATVALLAGCGSDDKDTAEGQQKAGSTGKPRAWDKPKSDLPKGKPHQVTLEIQGKGTTQIYYNLDSNGAARVTLPWKKTATITPVGAEREAGVLVTLAPGSTQGDDGMLYAAPCTITVDGKKVADNQGGKSNKPCEYKVK